jgi:hypothetical protein
MAALPALVSKGAHASGVLELASKKEADALPDKNLKRL